MPISARLERKLLDVLGDEAGQDMLDWMRDIEARHAIALGWPTARDIRARTELIAELRREIRAAAEASRRELREDLRTAFERPRAEHRS